MGCFDDIGDALGSFGSIIGSVLTAVGLPEFGIPLQMASSGEKLAEGDIFGGLSGFLNAGNGLDAFSGFDPTGGPMNMIAGDMTTAGAADGLGNSLLEDALGNGGMSQAATDLLSGTDAGTLAGGLGSIAAQPGGGAGIAIEGIDAPDMNLTGTNGTDIDIEGISKNAGSNPFGLTEQQMAANAGGGGNPGDSYNQPALGAGTDPAPEDASTGGGGPAVPGGIGAQGTAVPQTPSAPETVAADGPDLSQYPEAPAGTPIPREKPEAPAPKEFTDKLWDFAKEHPGPTAMAALAALKMLNGAGSAPKKAPAATVTPVQSLPPKQYSNAGFRYQPLTAQQTMRYGLSSNTTPTPQQIYGSLPVAAAEGGAIRMAGGGAPSYKEASSALMQALQSRMARRPASAPATRPASGLSNYGTTSKPGEANYNFAQPVAPPSGPSPFSAPASEATAPAAPLPWDLTGTLPGGVSYMAKGGLGSMANETAGGSNRGSRHVKGPGTGQSDDIPAYLSDGEYVIDADTVAALGDGSNEAGAKRLDEMRKKIRKHKRSAPADKIPPKAKKPEAYLARA